MRDYFDGKMLENTGSLVLRPGGFFRLEAGWRLSRVTFDDARASFFAAVLNGRAAVGFTPELNMDVFVGWNRLQRRVPVNVRLRWSWRRDSDVFLVWQGSFTLPESDASAAGAGEGPLGGGVFGPRGSSHSLLAKWTWSFP